MFIDSTNSKTMVVNRLINLSSCIYTVENLRTLAEIIITVHENISPRGSRIRVNMIGVDEMENIPHSSSMVELYRTEYRVGPSSPANRIHSNLLAKRLIWKFCNMKKGLRHSRNHNSGVYLTYLSGSSRWKIINVDNEFWDGLKYRIIFLSTKNFSDKTRFRPRKKPHMLRNCINLPEANWLSFKNQF